MEILNSIDDLQMYRGKDYYINEDITIHQPSLAEICEYGEREYFSMVTTLCSVGADMKWQLDDMGVDYTTIPDYELFYSVLARTFSTEQTRILFGDKINFAQMSVKHNIDIDDDVLVQFYTNDNDEEDCIQIDRYVYSSIVNVLRKMHHFKRNDEIPGNEATRLILIEDAREEYEQRKNDPVKSYLLPLISAMVNSEGFKHDDTTVFDMKIYAFMDSVSRIGKIKKADLLLQSGYSGFGIDLKKISKEETNWMGEL